MIARHDWKLEMSRLRFDMTNSCHPYHPLDRWLKNIRDIRANCGFGGFEKVPKKVKKKLASLWHIPVNGGSADK
jgi:hypothetical protein